MDYKDNFNNYSEIEQHYRSKLKISSELLFTQYLGDIYSNLLYRELKISSPQKNVSDTQGKNEKSEKNLSNGSSNQDSSSSDNENVGENELSEDSKGKSRNKKIKLHTFLEYINIQDYIGRHIFRVFAKSKDAKQLERRDFISGISSLYIGKLDDIINITFSIADFDCDGKINKNDIKQILYYIPRKDPKTQFEYVNFISDVIEKFFTEINEEMWDNNKDKNKNEIDLELYSKKVKFFIENYPQAHLTENLSSFFHSNGAFLLFSFLLSYLLKNPPFLPENLEFFKYSQKKFTYKIPTKNYYRRSESVKVYGTEKKTTVSNNLNNYNANNNGNFMNLSGNLGKNTTIKKNVVDSGNFKLNNIGKSDLFKVKRTNSVKNTLKQSSSAANIRRPEENKRDFIIAKKVGEVNPYSYMDKAKNFEKKEDKNKGKDKLLKQLESKIKSKFNDKKINDNLKSSPLAGLKAIESKNPYYFKLKKKENGLGKNFGSLKLSDIRKTSSANVKNNVPIFASKIKLSPIIGPVDGKNAPQSELLRNVESPDEEIPEFVLEVEGQEDCTNSKESEKELSGEKETEKENNQTKGKGHGSSILARAMLKRSKKSSSPDLSLAKASSGSIQPKLFSNSSLNVRKVSEDLSEFELCNEEEEKSNKDGENADYFEDYIYKISDEEKVNTVKKYYARLTKREILFFSSNDKKNLCTIWFVHKSYLKLIKKVVINSTFYASIEIKFNNGYKMGLFFANYEQAYKFFEKMKDFSGISYFEENYTQCEKIGEGHFATVFMCKKIGDNQNYAVKIMDKTKMKKNDLELIMVEKSYMQLLCHPNIINLIDCYEDEEKIYFVMDHYKVDLVSLIDNYSKNKKEMTEKTAAKIVKYLGRALNYLGKFGIVHRDVKPENILFKKEDDFKSLKLIDFGVATTLGYNEFATEGLGTIAYIAPEIYTRKPYNQKADMWSLGVILYFLISGGALPFDDSSMNEEIIGKKVVFTIHDYPSKYFGNKSKSVLHLIDKCLEKNSEKRISVEDFLKEEWVLKNSK